MASVKTTEFVRSTSHADSLPFTLIQQPGLISRLAREIKNAYRELSRDPRGFFRGLSGSDTKDAKRRQRIQIGLACALVVHGALLAVIAILGWRTVFVKEPEDANSEYEVIVREIRAAHPKVEPTQGDMPRGSEKGGGGGGQRNALAPSQGRPPLMLPVPQIVNMNPPTVQEPTLAVLPTIVGPESPPPPPGTIGDPAGKKSDEFSGGPGTDGGVGRGKGTGVGDGNDSGAGTGARGGKGGDKAGSSDGVTSSAPLVVDFNRVTSLSGYKPPKLIYSPRPVVTPEAQENKVIGIVVMRATFNANGTISDIEVLMPVEYMTESAVESLRRSTIRPATVNGVPITVRKVQIRVAVHY